MNLYLKQFLIIGLTFLLILWFQDCDDKKTKKERKTFFDMYKLPALVSAVLGLILNFNEIFSNNETIVEENIVVIKPINNNKMNTNKPNLKPTIKYSKGNFSDVDQQIYTELPDF
jgi:hypothetical protein